MNQNLELKSISELLEKDFYIPSYQRGYRWDSRQVEDLLEDIYDFSQKKERNQLKDKEFYCLQPIVIKKENFINSMKETSERYKVIDGQQRLTTIYIILKYLESARRFYDKKKVVYQINYETREHDNDNDSFDFLKRINETKEIKKENIDFYYMSKAYLTIKQWFENYSVNEVDILKILLNKDIKFENDKKIDYANNVRVIWYEIHDKSDDIEIDVFTRLNIGKIPLTNAELIKALFLVDKSKSTSNEKIILASQWDEIEYKLQSKTFFSFIHSSNYNKATKIEFIFDLIASDINLRIENLRKDDDKKSYYIFDKLVNDLDIFRDVFDIQNNVYDDYDKRVEFLWNKVKTYFRIFEELYTNNTYYHLVGYLVNNGKSIKNISRKFLKVDKRDFLKYLKKEISLLMKFKNDKSLESIEYGKNNLLITRILFLFNVVSTMNSKHSRYPFNLHKKENWSLEHIHPQNPDSLKDDEKNELLESYKEYASSKLKDKIINNTDSENIDELLEEILEEQGDNKNIHSISNMALLSKEKNSSLSNSLFVQKRKQIIEWDKDGIFIPIGTKNVFLKYYTDNPKEIKKWDKIDKSKYLDKLKKILAEYIGENND